MLRHLRIQNYALISHLDITFNTGFSVLTGETGAGKSIILGALNLVMGGRADTRTITEGEERCIIEAEFQTDTDSLLIRRELNTNGRSRSFVNDEVVTQSELKALAARLIDIHSQHANLLLGDDLFQLYVVDTIADNAAQRNEYDACYQDYTTALDALHQLERQAADSRKEADFITFQHARLQEAALIDGELEELQAEEYRLSHAEEIQTALQQAVQLLDGDDSGALARIRSCRLDHADDELQQRLDSVSIELRDIVSEASRMVTRIEADPARLEWVQQRIDTLQTLMRKHNCDTIAALISLRDRLSEQLRRLDSFDDDLRHLQQDLTHKTERLQQAADALTQSRQAVCPTIAERLITDLSRLGIAHANFGISITPLPDFTPTGRDNVQLLFAANLGQSLRPVSEVASGGEISRVMLCVKALIAATNGLPTIIFDEIDTGVSGEVASRMGAIMRSMASSRQIIAITHLPQIAAWGEAHYRVFKQDTNRRTETHIARLDREQRITELAAMLSGDAVTPAARKNAEALIHSTVKS